MKKSIFAVLTLTLFTGAASAADLIEGIVIRVGDRIVTRTQYERRLRDLDREIEQSAPPDRVAELKKTARETLTDDLIGELLVKDRADRLAITVTEPEIKEAINRLKQQYNIQTDQQFEDSLRQSGMTRADMEARLRETLITNKVFGRELRSRAEATDAELRERYNREKEAYRLPERAALREIVILRPTDPSKVAEAQQKAEDVAAAAKQPGTDFSKLATTMSEAATREQGGDLGEVAKGDLVPELDTLVFNAQAGAIIGPVESKAAWHIMKVEQRLPSEVPAFESVKDRLRREADDAVFQRDLKAYIDNLRKDAFVQINDEMIPKG